MLYSVRMRAAEGGAHEMGGCHISGAERLAKKEEISLLAQQMLERAFSHPRGQADFINLTIEAFPAETVQHVPLLPITTIEAKTVVDAHVAAKKALLNAGVTETAFQNGIRQLLALPTVMRGAMLLCAQTGGRLDDTGMRGVRVSRMDSYDDTAFRFFLGKQGLNQDHAREAMLLAAKVAAAKDVLAELCWSDDPDYTTGYVATKQSYTRITHLKEQGNLQGGRLFFIHPTCDCAALCSYLEKQPVLVASTF